MEELKVNEKADKENIEIYKEMGCSKSYEYRHTCVICGVKTNINNSFSNQGRKLICRGCFYKVFGRFGYDDLFKWQEED